MDKRIVGLWEKNKGKLKEYFETTRQEEYDDYTGIVQAIVRIILNNNGGSKNPDYSENIHVIDDGDYQGSQIFIIPQKTYLPSCDEYLVTYSFYGSCSGCDTLQGINSYDDGLPNENQVEGYMTLCLHLIQKMKPLYSSNELW